MKSSEMMGLSRDEAVGYAVAEWDESDGDERGNSIANVTPIDCCHLTNHQATDLKVSN